jgi:RND family efflux transporter MFP subunit
MSSDTTTPSVHASPLPNTPPKASPLSKLVVLAVLIGLAVPVGIKIKAATAKQRALEEDRSKSAVEATSKASAPVEVKVVKGEASSWSPSVPFDGTLQPIQEAMLAFKATGPLSVLKVKTGDFVKKGELLAALDATEAHAQSQAASAQIKAAQAQLALAKDNAQRTEAMVKGGSAPQIQQTQAQGQLDLVTAQLDGAQAQLALAGANIRNHTLSAPFAGFVTMAPNALGGLVAAGVPTFQMKDVSRLRMVGTISELDAPLVKVGADVVVKLETSGKQVTAKVTSVLPAVDPATRRIPVEAELDNDPKDPILAGTFVRAHVAGGEPVKVVKLPGSALRPGSQDEVLTVEGGRLKVAKVVFTRATDGSLLVRSGLSARETVLANPSPEAKDGDKVAVTE